MNTFNFILQRFLIASFALSFAFVATYTPQPVNHVEKAEAAAIWGATEWTQIANAAIAAWNWISNTASEYYNKVAAWAQQNLWTKEFTLDGIAWALAKMLIAEMASSIVDWINSGFEGSPSFVQDLDGFLLDVADKAVGGYLESLGGIGSFLCAPFNLDIRIALAMSYDIQRDGQNVCRLTDALANIESFIGGGDFAESGGWDAWFSITSQPNQYTPYGSFLEGQNRMNYELINAQEIQENIVSYGSGFLSSKHCEPVAGSEEQESCYIETPGQTIQEALSFQLTTGEESLIAADEIDEIIGGFIAQLAQQAITGAGGLLGLSGGNGGPQYNGSSYLDQLQNSSTLNTARLAEDIQAALDNEILYVEAMIGTGDYYNKLRAAEQTNPDPRQVREIKRAADDIEPDPQTNPPTGSLYEARTLITQLRALLAEYNALPIDSNASARQEIITRFLRLKLHSEAEVEADIFGWQALLRDYQELPRSLQDPEPDPNCSQAQADAGDCVIERICYPKDEAGGVCEWGYSSRENIMYIQPTCYPEDQEVEPCRPGVGGWLMPICTAALQAAGTCIPDGVNWAFPPASDSVEVSTEGG